MTRLPQSSFELSVEQGLRRAKLDVEVHPRIGGLQPDFLVTTPSGRKVIVEAKGWVMDRAMKDRAIHQVKRYEQATGADRVYLVVPERPASWKATNVLTLDALLARLSNEPGKASLALSQASRRRTAKQQKPSPVTVFAAMPFAPEFDDVFLVSMAGAAKSNNVTCVRVDRDAFEGDVVSRVKELIDRSRVVIADLSSAKPNVLFEVGYAHGLKKPVVPICCTPMSDLPFDVRNWNTIQYRAGRTHELIKPLALRLKQALKSASA